MLSQVQHLTLQGILMKYISRYTSNTKKLNQFDDE